MEDRPYPASDVHVTGTFDDWGKTEQLNKVGDGWEKEVNLPSADQKIYYKFVVDNEWVVDHNAPKEEDGHNNVNNFLLPEQIKKHSTAHTEGLTSEELGTGAFAAISTVSPDSTTAKLAGEVPKEEPSSVERTPGAFPETPANEPDSFSVKPIPATGATSVQETVTTSKEDYEKAGSAALGVAGGAALGGAALGGAAATELTQSDDAKEQIIPESSLPMKPDEADAAGPFISSVGPDATTTGLAAGVPVDKKRQGMIIDSDQVPSEETPTASSVPEVVKESLHEAHQDPEAAASSEAVKEKADVEHELLGKVTSSEATGDPASAAAAQTSYYGLATSVPPTVEKSMEQAHASPEAAADSSVVAEKAAVEQELLKKVPSEEGAGEPAPSIAAATSETAPAPTDEPRTATGEQVPGTSAIAAAAVADGTAGADTAPATETKPVVAERTEADATEYAPVQKDSSTPGVAPSAAAAVADGTEDPTLADEPAVQMMNQHESEGVPATESEAKPVTETTASPVHTDGVTEAKKDVAEPTATPAAGAAVSTATEAKKAEAPSAASTPAKPTASAPTSSPATSATKESETKKKKRHRVSGFFKKIFE